MIIICFLFQSLAEYLVKGKELEVVRPDTCLRQSCQQKYCFWKHTAYSRHVQDGAEPVSIKIQRFKCRYCNLVISCLFSFLVPYRRYSAKVVADSIETYATAPAVAPLESYRKIAKDRSSTRMSVFRWTDFMGTKSKAIHAQVQKEFMLSGQPWQMLSAVPEHPTSPSSRRAKSEEKKEKLNRLFGLVEISKVFLGSVTCVLEQLHAHFLKNIESRQLILTGRKIAHRAQQSMGPMLF
jgi:uncharacterized protein DUF6431